ncbi:uncharacterized protein SPPG_03678 [Spizellomyces punctatus DAOM BR117]|uniref:Uncharacterized protein n=1 Tax=Spizellomyces punctatus (strain DAOM BR117) TaxID=645134 RepID=A0A0L0HL86_SPIPD|nr:uncharacterized protein SPPG_03678 [Spizellomyces punctatus DAOM BR117]KND01892.1 hypothetical protein SPPG_03678 [Spizellomyces punctatus DAOM BR117]|eukprot:XP_016609931.1 hypothetical protein SPPG_03678 [Spizellomyces punctatus DAOM BR117]
MSAMTAPQTTKKGAGQPPQPKGPQIAINPVVRPPAPQTGKAATKAPKGQKVGVVPPSLPQPKGPQADKKAAVPPPKPQAPAPAPKKDDDVIS